MIFSTSRGPATLATFVAVYALFGPTYPGIFDKDRGIYTLFYPVHILEIGYQMLVYYCLICLRFLVNNTFCFMFLLDRSLGSFFCLSYSKSIYRLLSWWWRYLLYHLEIEMLYLVFLFCYIDTFSFDYDSGIAVGVSWWNHTGHLPCFYIWQLLW